MTKPFNASFHGILLATLGFSLFSIGDVFAKIMADDFNSFQVGFWICCMSLTGLFCISPELGGVKQVLQSKNIILHIIRGLCSFISLVMVVNAFHKLGMATTYTILFAGPFIAAILSIFILNAKIGIHRWTSIVIGFIGVMVVLRPGIIPLDTAALGVLLAACGFGLSTNLAKKIGSVDPIITFMFYNTIVPLTALTITLLLTNGFEKIPSLQQITYFISVSFFHIGAGLAVTRAFRDNETSIIAPLQYLQLLWGVLFGYILFNKTIDVYTGVGAVIIVCSGIYLIYRERIHNTYTNKGVTLHGDID